PPTVGTLRRRPHPPVARHVRPHPAVPHPPARTPLPRATPSAPRNAPLGLSRRDKVGREHLRRARRADGLAWTETLRGPVLTSPGVYAIPNRRTDFGDHRIHLWLCAEMGHTASLCQKYEDFANLN